MNYEYLLALYPRIYEKRCAFLICVFKGTPGLFVIRNSNASISAGKIIFVYDLYYMATIEFN